MAEWSLIQQASSLIGALRASVKDGKIVADEATVETRASVCMGCDKLREKNGKYSCVTCGCGFKRKIALHGSACPLGKW